ncbi:MAG TPA: efflux RND transporter periplasmic adaptor subunit [Candidatus Acidoferrales bacterium]|nr:efflux RND transporter periplasmic adaptor subunit [Candidatus Acidoferrales bacterium]
MTRRKWIRLSLALAAAASLVVAGCSKGGGDSDEGGGDNASANMVAEVTVVKVTRANIQQVITLSGNVIALPNEDVKVSALVAGRITTLTVAEGDRVTKGEVMATLDDSTYQQQYEQAQATLLQAQATLKNAQQTTARNQTLFSRGIVSRADLETAQTNLDIAHATEQQDRAAEQLAHLQLERTKIISPLTGVVAKRFASIGEQVDGTAAQPIVEVADIAQLDLAGNLPADYLGKIHVGETLPVSSDSLPGKTFTGRVVAIAPAVDPSTNVGGVRIRIANPGGVLKLGMFLTAQVQVETHKNALVVPAQAVYRDEDGKPQVYIVSGDTAKASDVTLGIQDAGKTEILDGVKDGDTIVDTGGYGLGDTTKIKVKS